MFHLLSLRSAFLLNSLLAIFLMAPVPALRAEEGSRPIYVVDMQKVIDSSIAGKAAKSNMDQEIKKSEKKLALLKNEREKFQAELEKQAGLLSEQALQDKKDALAQKETEFARAVNDSREDLAKLNSKEIEVVVKAIDQVVKDMASKNKYELIIEKDARYLVFVDEQFDLTDKVVEELNRRKLDLEG